MLGDTTGIALVSTNSRDESVDIRQDGSVGKGDGNNPVCNGCSVTD